MNITEQIEKMQGINYGVLRPEIVGSAMKDIVHRAMDEIRNKRIGYVGYDKENELKAGGDRVTEVDYASQAIFLAKLTEYFPEYGIVAEEHSFSRPSQLPDGLFFTVDPLDGTKAFERKQSAGFGPMLSLCN